MSPRLEARTQVLSAAKRWPVFDLLHGLALRKRLEDDLPETEMKEDLGIARANGFP